MHGSPIVRRRLIALLLARGQIGSAPARDSGGQRVDEPAERELRVGGEAEAAAGLERTKPR